MDRAILSRTNFISSPCILSTFACLLLPFPLLLLLGLSKPCSSQLNPSSYLSCFLIKLCKSSNYNVSLVLNVIRWHLLQNFPFILPHSKSSLNCTSKWWVNIIKSLFYVIASTSLSKIWKMIPLSLIRWQKSFP